MSMPKMDFPQPWTEGDMIQRGESGRFVIPPPHPREIAWFGGIEDTLQYIRVLDPGTYEWKWPGGAPSVPEVYKVVTVTVDPDVFR